MKTREKEDKKVFYFYTRAKRKDFFLKYNFLCLNILLSKANLGRLNMTKYDYSQFRGKIKTFLGRSDQSDQITSDQSDQITL